MISGFILSVAIFPDSEFRVPSSDLSASWNPVLSPSGPVGFDPNGPRLCAERKAHLRYLKRLLPFAVMDVASPPIPQPVSTLYINNLNEKLKRKRLQDSLRAVFKQFGEILAIHCWPKSLSRKGQAWVIFRDVPAAVKAQQSMQGFPFYEKAMNIQFARTESDLIAKAKGTFVPKPKKKPGEKKPKTKKDAPMVAGNYELVHDITMLRRLVVLYGYVMRQFIDGSKLVQ